MSLKYSDQYAKLLFKFTFQKSTARMNCGTGRIQSELFHSCLNIDFQMTVLKISSGNDCISCSSGELAALQLLYKSYLVSVTKIALLIIVINIGKLITGMDYYCKLWLLSRVVDHPRGQVPWCVTAPASCGIQKRQQSCKAVHPSIPLGVVILQLQHFAARGQLDLLKVSKTFFMCTIP